jgi:hypothetical protein
MQSPGGTARQGARRPSIARSRSISDSIVPYGSGSSSGLGGKVGSGSCGRGDSAALALLNQALALPS